MTWAVKVDYAKKVAELEKKIEELNTLVQRKNEEIVNLEKSVAYVSSLAHVPSSAFNVVVYTREGAGHYNRLPIIQQQVTTHPGGSCLDVNVLVDPPWRLQPREPQSLCHPGYHQMSQNTMQSGSTGKEWWTRDDLAKKWYLEEKLKRP